MESLIQFTPINILILVNLVQFAWNILSSSSQDLKENTHAVIKLQVEMKAVGDRLEGLRDLEQNLEIMEDKLHELSFFVNQLRKMETEN